MMTEELRTPAEWEKELGVQITDPDGWDRTNFKEDWAKPISREEFNQKLTRSTVTDLAAVGRALGWLDDEQTKARLIRESEIPEDERPTFHDLLYGEGQNGVDRVADNISKVLGLKQRGQHVRRS